MLEALSDRAPYDLLEDSAAAIEVGLLHILDDLGVAGRVNHQGSMLCLYFSERPVRSLQDAMDADAGRFNHWHQRMLEEGILLPPSPFEAWFLSTVHTTEDIDQILEAARNALT